MGEHIDSNLEKEADREKLQRLKTEFEQSYLDKQTDEDYDNADRIERELESLAIKYGIRTIYDNPINKPEINDTSEELAERLINGLEKILS